MRIHYSTPYSNCANIGAGAQDGDRTHRLPGHYSGRSADELPKQHTIYTSDAKRQLQSESLPKDIGHLGPTH